MATIYVEDKQKPYNKDDFQIEEKQFVDMPIQLKIFINSEELKLRYIVYDGEVAKF